MPDWKRMSNRKRAATFDFLGIPHDFKVRAPRQAKDNPDNENHVLREVGQYLALEPRCWLVVRQNSGGASYEHSSGDYKPLLFYKLLRPNTPITITDYWGLVEYGSRVVPYAIECKRRDWTGIRTEREERQAAFIKLIQDAGGIGGFCRSADEAHKLLG